MKGKIFQVKAGVSLLLVNLCVLWYFVEVLDQHQALWVQWCTTIFLAAFVFFSVQSQQKKLRLLWGQAGNVVELPQVKAFNTLPLPVAVLNSNQELIWCNRAFGKELGAGADAFGDSISKYLPGVQEAKLQGGPTKLRCGAKEYLAFFSRLYEGATKREELTFLCLYDNSEYANLLVESENAKPVVAMLVLDNYDAVMQKTGELERGRVESRLDYEIKTFFEGILGFAQKTDKDKFLVLLGKEQLQQLTDSETSILGRIKQAAPGCEVVPTISVGACNPNTPEFSKKLEEARKALDMALGRGGDQVAVKKEQGYEFFGGLTNDTEERSAVKVRIVSSALSSLVSNSENVVVMGHKFADLDCFGAAVGVARIARDFGKPVRIAINQTTSMVGAQLSAFLKSGQYEDIFADLDDVLPLVNAKTLLIVVDLHTVELVEFPEVLEKAKNIVVIDHHRKMVNYINNALLFYHEPFASSASEMVTELIRYLGGRAKLNKLEAAALFSGMVLDTKNFVFKTSARTFKAAALLKDAGADTVNIRKMFADTMDEYREINRIVSGAEFFNNCAICLTGGSGAGARLLIAKAADSLMNIKGLDAAFVIYEGREGCLVSARSFGEVNVQVIMEALGGGGHKIMAAAQLVGKNGKEVVEMLKGVLGKNLKG